MNYRLRLTLFSSATFLGFLSLAAFAGAGSLSITVVATYDYPGAKYTFPFGISNRGDVAGYYTDAASSGRGFIRFRDGSLSAPIVAPSGTNNFTQTYGINAAGTIVGDFFNQEESSWHGYLLRGTEFTIFDFNETASTFIYAINDSEDFSGAASYGGYQNQAFVNVGGVTTVISIPGAYISNAYGINSRDVVVGSYLDSTGNGHGFIFDAAGNLTAPFDYPGSLSTDLYGENDRGVIVGRFQSSDRLFHGLLYSPSVGFVQYDYPGATYTSLDGINRAGYISGQYNVLDSAHGFVARVRISN